MQLKLFKTCRRCNKTKLITAFHKHKGFADGRKSLCADCSNEELRTFNNLPENIEKRKNKRIERRSNPEEVEKDRARDRNRYDETRREKHNENQRKRYANPKEREKMLAYQKKYAKENPEQYRLSRHTRGSNRRARLIEAEGSFTNDEWFELCAKYDFRCLYCGEMFPFEKLTHDHVVPLSKGGTNYISNLQPLCLKHNVEKGTKTIDYRPLWD